MAAWAGSSPTIARPSGFVIMAKELTKEMTDYLAALKLVREKEQKINPAELKALRKEKIKNRIPHWHTLLAKKRAAAVKLHEKSLQFEERSLKATARADRYEAMLKKWD